jgi:hypothetical protein
MNKSGELAETNPPPGHQPKGKAWLMEKIFCLPFTPSVIQPYPLTLCSRSPE